MNRLLAFGQSSIGKKVLMGLTGLFLCTFLIVHLAINLLVLVPDGGETYNAYSHFMATNGVIRIVELLLFLSLIWHSWSGLLVWWQNRAARPEKYAAYRLKDNAPFASRITMVTGSVVFFFLVVHIRTFMVPLRFTQEHPSPFVLNQQAFSSGLYSSFYIIALALLAYHLRHGFQAAFQTLGLRDKRYSGLLDVVAILFWLIIPLGFAVIPVYFYFFHSVINATMALGVQ